jgi:hypothetical protein
MRFVIDQDNDASAVAAGRAAADVHLNAGSAPAP